MELHPPADRFEFWVRFVCGTLLGGVVGFCIWLQLPEPSPHVWLAFAGLCALFGLLAGWFGDPFWRVVLSWCAWWW